MSLTPTAKKNAITGKNTLLAYRLNGQTPEASFVTIPGVTVISTPGGTVEDVDQTCIAEDAKRYLPGAYDGNEITLTIHHYTGDETQAALIAAANSNAIVDIQVEFQDGTTCDITVALKSAQMQEISLSETLKWDIIGKQSGKAVWTLPSA